MRTEVAQTSEWPAPGILDPATETTPQLRCRGCYRPASFLPWLVFPEIPMFATRNVVKLILVKFCVLVKETSKAWTGVVLKGDWCQTAWPQLLANFQSSEGLTFFIEKGTENSYYQHLIQSNSKDNCKVLSLECLKDSINVSYYHYCRCYFYWYSFPGLLLIHSAEM